MQSFQDLYTQVQWLVLPLQVFAAFLPPHHTPIAHFLTSGQIKSLAGSLTVMGNVQNGRGEDAYFNSVRGMWLNTTTGLLIVSGYTASSTSLHIFLTFIQTHSMQNFGR